MKTFNQEKTYAAPSVKLWTLSQDVSVLASGSYGAEAESMNVEEDVDW